MKESPRAEDIFFDALERPDTGREAFVIDTCRGDDTLLAEVRSLLASHARAGGFLESPAIGAAAEAVRDQGDSTIGRQIGAFRVIRRVGSGGMGHVYLAERAEGEFKQEVAIKLLHRGVFDDDALRRFRNECQVLAMLEHPNIARMIDGGFTEDGTPFIVMEYVDGVAIDRYCEENELNTTRRLDLFRVVCDTVQHAHRHSTIHRDIKPGNILVDRSGTVKLVDFGIARVIDAAEGAPLERTDTSRQMLTPLYASPEQIRGEVLSTSTDVYSLGVVLYKLLTGHVPYMVRSGSIQEMASVLEDTHPTRPSEVVLRPESERTTTTRAGDTRKISRELRGDLDTIVLMALRKEPDRRYSSADQFSQDLHRHLRGLPVIAQPDTFGYRAGKFVRRNAAAVTAGVVITIVLIASTIIAFSMYQRSEDARHDAISARDEALLHRAAAEQISDFLQELLASVDPVHRDSRQNMTVREALSAAAGRIDQELAGQPSVAAALHNTIGNAYFNLGIYDDAHVHLDRSLEIRRAADPVDNEGIMMSLVSLGQLRWKLAEFPLAEAHLREAIAIGEAGKDTDPSVMAECELTLSRVLSEQAKYGEAEEFARRSSQTADRITDPKSRVRAQSLNEVGVVLYNIGRYGEAEAVLREAVSVSRATLGSRHAFTGECLNNLGILVEVSGRPADAISIYQEAIDIYAVTYPNDHPEMTMTRMNQADALQYSGKYDEAIEIYRDVRQKFETVYGPDHVNVGMAYNNMAFTMWKKWDLEGARPMFVEAIRILEATLGPSHPGVGTCKNNYAKVLRALGENEEAERIANESLATSRAGLPEGHHLIARPLSLVAEIYMDRGDFAGAEPMMVEVMEIIDGSIDKNGVDYGNAEILWGRLLVGLARYQEAEAPLLHAYAMFDSIQGSSNDRTQRALRGLVSLYKAWDKPDQATRYDALISAHDIK